MILRRQRNNRRRGCCIEGTFIIVVLIFSILSVLQFESLLKLEPLLSHDLVQKMKEKKPKPPRNNTVIWHCHMGGDPNPKGGGIMKQMRNFMGAYILAQERHAHLYKGNLSYESTDNTEGGCNAPLELMVDIDAIPDLQDMLVEQPIGEHIGVPCEPCDALTWTDNRTAAFKLARKAFKVSKRLRALVPQTLCPPEVCVCLHSRLEEDFVKVFGKVLAGSADHIARAMTKHVEAGGFGNATILYVAGQQQIDSYRSIPQFTEVTNKPDYPFLRPFEKALIDLQICQNAMFHVGTSRSIFDEWISEERLLKKRTRSWDYLENHVNATRGLNEFRLVANHGFTMADVHDKNNIKEET